MTELKKVDNSLYSTTLKIGASKPRQIAWYITNILFFRNSLFVFSGAKVALLRLFGAKVGKGVVIKQAVNIKFPWKLTIGDHAWIGEGVWIDNLSDVFIESHVTLSQGAMLLTGTHDHKKETFDFSSLPITLEEGSWICAKAVVLGGVTGKSHCILATNSVAEKDLDAYTIYKGNPSVQVGKRNIG